MQSCALEETEAAMGEFKTELTKLVIKKLMEKRDWLGADEAGKIAENLVIDYFNKKADKIVNQFLYPEVFSEVD